MAVFWQTVTPVMFDTYMIRRETIRVTEYNENPRS